MLAELHISGLGVIEDAVIEPAPGLTVVTGETGAGKTMIVTALGLVCGGRADSGRVRQGAPRAVVEARFAAAAAGTATEHDAAHGQHLLAAAEAVGGDVDDDGSLLAVRSVSADGRSRAHVGGRSAPVAALADLTEPLVAVHGQAEAMTLLRPANQRAVLDAYAGLAGDLADYRSLRAEWLDVQARIDERVSRARDLAQREALLRLGTEEIERADPRPGEDHEIAAEVRRQSDADALRAAATEALGALVGSLDIGSVGDEPSATGLVQHAIRTLEAAPDPALSGRIGDLRGALAVLGDVGADLTRYLDDLDADPERLQSLLERQAVLRALVRKYGADVDAVLAWAREAAAELAGLDSSDEAIAALRTRAEELRVAVIAAAKTITARRTAAAARLAKAATAELAHLAMGKSRLMVAVTPLPELGADGADHVELLLAAHAGAPEIPVARGASGGELSRIMLALEVVLAGADPVSTLVFDEVDAGVGGRAATEIGSRLAALAKRHQVIVVTHLAQVAAFADRHYVVDADADGSVGASAVRAVDDQERLVELARMLGGTDGATARAHAADLRVAALAR
jgi:DNA repair protein RecN (Recombination protein N)